MKQTRFHTIDTLRGIACLAVVWFHFTHSNPLAFIRYSGMYGWLGVGIFFVISGFIIPHTLALAKYDLRDYGSFLLKRIVRLDPAYLVTIAAILILGYLDQFAPGYRGPSPFQPTLPQVLLHLGYLNAVFDYPWLNVVFWSLAVEFQYYLFIGLVFPILVSRHLFLRVTMFVALSASALLLTSDRYFFHYLFLFMMGFLTFYFRGREMGWKAYLIGLCILGAGAFQTLGLPMAAMGVATSLVIAFVEIQSPRFAWLGHISYSLYLCHLPIGSRAARLCEKFIPGTLGSMVGLLLALAGSLFVAALLHRFVERPSQIWSSAIGYRSRQVAPSGFGPRVG